MADVVRTEIERRKRVQRLKKIIIVLLLAFILIPIIMCIILFVQMQKMEEQMKKLTEMVEENAAHTQEEAIMTVMGGQATKQEEQLQDIMGQIPAMSDTMAEEESAKRKVYLTFDDGPSVYTQTILDILAEYDVKATFFVVGKEDEKSLALYKKIVEGGHTIGMHSYSHKYNEVYSSVENFQADMQRLQDLLYTATGVKSQYYRFPGGSSNQVSQTDMQDLIQCLEDNRLTYYDWNISSGDAVRTGISTQDIVDNCLQKIRDYDNAMILMHDAGSKATTVEALPTIIEKILEIEDTVILPITEDTVPIQHVTKKIDGETEE